MASTACLANHAIIHTGLGVAIVDGKVQGWLLYPVGKK
jgi:hypothetical protein